MEQKVVYLHSSTSMGNIGGLEKDTTATIEEQARKGYELMGTPSISHNPNGLVITVALAFNKPSLIA